MPDWRRSWLRLPHRRPGNQLLAAPVIVPIIVANHLPLRSEGAAHANRDDKVKQMMHYHLLFDLAEAIEKSGGFDADMARGDLDPPGSLTALSILRLHDGARVAWVTLDSGRNESFQVRMSPEASTPILVTSDAATVVAELKRLL